MRAHWVLSRIHFIFIAAFLAMVVHTSAATAQINVVNCESYPGGKAGLIQELQEALRVGTECMKGGSPEIQLEASAISNLMIKPDLAINLFCGKRNDTLPYRNSTVSFGGAIATSLVPGEDTFGPGIAINIDADLSTPGIRKSMLFHEMIHWLRINHYFNFDTAYIASNCCFAATDVAEVSEISCKLMKANPRPDFRSDDYVRDFTRLMTLIKRPTVGGGNLLNRVNDALQEKKFRKLELYRTLAEKLDPNSAITTKLLVKTIDAISNVTLPEGEPTQFEDDVAQFTRLMFEKTSASRFNRNIGALEKRIKQYIKELDEEGTFMAYAKDELKLALGMFDTLVARMSCTHQPEAGVPNPEERWEQLKKILDY